MPSPHERAIVVSEWVAKAESDLKSAQLLLTAEDPHLAETACFHVQQCVEKYLKALLVHEDNDFPKTHDIEELVRLLPGRITLDVTLEDQRRLTSYAATMRYPGDYESIPPAEARRALKTARRIRKHIRQLLPKETLHRRK